MTYVHFEGANNLCGSFILQCFSFFNFFFLRFEEEFEEFEVSLGVGEEYVGRARLEDDEKLKRIDYFGRFNLFHSFEQRNVIFSFIFVRRK